MQFESRSGAAPVTLRRVLMVSVVLPALLASCHDDPRPPRVTLANAWPNEDGRMWSYEATRSQWLTQPFPPEVLFESPEDVPPAPGRDEVAELLDVVFTGPPIGEPETALYTLQFAGTDTTHSGATGQNLAATVSPISVPAKSVATTPTLTTAFLARLAEVRPDLRARILSRSEQPSADNAAIDPVFLSGGTWEKTNEWIGKYGDLNTQLAWLYLNVDLHVGSEFEFQLVPDLADDVFLHVWVLGHVTVETDAGTFRSALEVIYQVDFGLSPWVDVDGDILGYSRSFDIARIAYAANIGPVECEERSLYTLGPSGVIGPLYTLSLPLHSTQAPER